MKKVLLSNSEIFLIAKAIDFYASQNFKPSHNSLSELEHKLEFLRSSRLLLDKLASSEVNNV